MAVFSHEATSFLSKSDYRKSTDTSKSIAYKKKIHLRHKYNITCNIKTPSFATLAYVIRKFSERGRTNLTPTSVIE